MKGADDHDQRFKSLLREFLPEFFGLFFPDRAARLELALSVDGSLDGGADILVDAPGPNLAVAAVRGRGALPVANMGEHFQDHAADQFISDLHGVVRFW